MKIGRNEHREWWHLTSLMRRAVAAEERQAPPAVGSAVAGARTGPLRGSPRACGEALCPPSRCRALADLRKALVGPLQGVEVIGPVAVERLVGEMDNPA